MQSCDKSMYYLMGLQYMCYIYRITTKKVMGDVNFHESMHILQEGFYLQSK